jgi:hypothetical protein
MKLNELNPRKALNKAFLKVKPIRVEIENFKTNLITLLDTTNDKESEEFHKNLVSDFLKDTYYKQNYFINTKGRNDLVIHNGNNAKTTVGVIIEAKKPTNKSEMISAKRLNAKAFQELVLYYLRERITHKNLDVKHLVATNINEWFIFDEHLFEKLFAQNKAFVKQFENFEASKKTTDVFYKEIAEPFIDSITSEIEYTYFNIQDFQKTLRNEDKSDDNSLIALFKLLSPEHLLKLPFANDSNSLDKRFYGELLHIIGLTETKEGSKKIIQRNKSGERNSGTILEDTIIQLDSLDKLSRLDKPSQFGTTSEEQLFNVALELAITWINRILFLKLLEGQLISYHRGDKSYAFLNGQNLKEYDDLNSLFFQVLARKVADRNEDVMKTFAKVPYLNSSLFEPTELEQITLFISNLKDDKTIPIYSQTVLKDQNGKTLTGKLTALQYLFEFLNAYDFSSEGSEEIQEENKTLINASVLGLIFEKINGYRDGSIFTPSFITMYMSKETLRKAVIQKFNEAKGWNCKNFDELKEDIQEEIKSGNRKEVRKIANQIINSLKIVDPAVGSGHFLVSVLNELIAIKSELKILVDKDFEPLSAYQVEVQNDELIIIDSDGKLFQYFPNNTESQRIQETLFHEKQTLIENCLFGVDINPNSVKICRLRLWIELLKNAYYKNESELETLPNIDINIKCGNSLISRFSLDSDLKEILKKSKFSIQSYRVAVETYRNAKSKEQKREMERLIAEIKSDFRSEITLNDPKLKKLRKLSGDLFQMTNQGQLFEMGKKEQVDWNKKVKQLNEETKKLENEIEEIKANKIYENAFEWRFEFPEVLSDEGEFVGFDVVIGNPPYGVKLIDREKEYFKKRFTTTSGEVEIYTFFIELGMTDLLRLNGIFSYITTNTIYYLDKFSQIRKGAFLGNRVISLLELEKQVFADAPDIVPAIYILQKSVTSNNIIRLYKSTETKTIYDLVNFEGFEINKIEQVKFETKNDFVFSLSTNEAKENLLKRISQLEPIKKSYKVVYGIKTGDNERFISKEIKGIENWKKCASSAKNIKKYTIDWQGDYLNVCNELAGLNNINYEQPKILIQYIRKLSMPVRLVCALDLNGEYYPLNNFSFIVSENNNSLKALLGIINSKFMNWYFSNSFVDYNIKPKYIDQLPLPSKINSIEIEGKVIEIISQKAKDKEADTRALENQIDKLVYDLYGLTEEEIKIVEGV